MSAKETARTSPGVTPADVANYADMLAAMGSEARLRIMRRLLAAHPDGLVVGEIQAELGMPPIARCRITWRS